MEFSYELGREECRRASVVFQHLDPTWPLVRAARALSVVVALAALLGAVLAAGVSWTLAAGAAAVCGWGLLARVCLVDRLCRTPGVPAGPIPVELSLGERGITVRIHGELHELPWSRVDRLVDAGWAVFISVSQDEWLALPARVLRKRRAELTSELAARTGLSFVPLP